MRISRLKLRNWKNFRNVDLSELPEIVYVVGPNASGKSNLLDAMNFLRDMANPVDGGLLQAVRRRGGMRKIRCLHARVDADMEIEIDLSDDEHIMWTYNLAFNSQPGSEDPLVVREIATRHCKNGGPKTIFKTGETSNGVLQISNGGSMANNGVKRLVDFFSEIEHFHVIPQLVRFGDQIGGKLMNNDPFGQNFIEKMFLESHAAKKAKIQRIEKSLKSLLPQIQKFNLIMDKKSGKPHLVVKLKGHEGNGMILQEDQLSDGTIRLISMLWICSGLSSHAVIIEDPELFLNDGVMNDFSAFFGKSMWESKNRGQLFVSTHNSALLSNPGINPYGVVVVRTSQKDSKAEKMNRHEWKVIDAGLSASDGALQSVERASRIDLGL